MNSSKPGVPPLVPGAGEAQTRAILGAMRAVAETGGPASADDRRALASADQYMFGHPAPFVFDNLARGSPEDLAAALAGSDLARDALKFLTVMALVDGRLDKAKITEVMRYAAALGVEARHLDEVREATQGRLREALADMTRCNMASITNRPWTGGDATDWLLPYKGAGADPVLAARFETLAALPDESFGRRFWRHFKENRYSFPGDPQALNAGFCVPHDSAHVLTGYNTTPRGEILVSTFTAAMHPEYPMAGHVLPVIFSWHLRTQINPVAGEAGGALDPMNSGTPGPAARRPRSTPSRRAGISGTTPRRPSRRFANAGRSRRVAWKKWPDFEKPASGVLGRGPQSGTFDAVRGRPPQQAWPVYWKGPALAAAGTPCSS